MKHIFYTVTFLLCSAFALHATAQTEGGIAFFEGSFEEALEEAKKQDKLLFVDFYAVWCGPCKRLAKEVFPQPEVGDYFNDKFISLQINAEKEENVEIAKKYKVEAFPTLGFFDTNGKTLLIRAGALTAEELIHAGKIVTGEAISFEELYKQYRKKSKDLELQKELLVQAPQFIATLEGLEHEKWMVRVKKLYRQYINSKLGDDLINVQDYIIITNYDGLDATITEKILAFMTANLPKWRAEVGDPVCYFIIEHNDQEMEELAKNGDESYKELLEKIKGEYQEAYSVVPYQTIDPYTKSKYYMDALYSVYKEKDADQYISLMNEYLNALGEDAHPENYGKAAQDLYYAMGQKLQEPHHQTAIGWLEKALQGDAPLLDKINFIVMIGDSYKSMGNYENAKAFYNQAFIQSHGLKDMEMAQEMIQGAIKMKLAELELLQD